jgi:long-chain fatty acid transport protein
MRSHTLLARLLALFGAGFTTATFAVGFALPEQGVVATGYAFAGVSANPEDASTIFFNPAGMSFLREREASMAMHAIDVTARFSNAGSLSPAGPAFPLAGGDGGNPIGLNWVPNFYMAAPGPRLSFGLGVGAPFGLKTEYPGDSMGRYQALSSDVKTLNINPSLAYRVGAGSIGFGVNFQYMRAELGNALDFGAACFGSAFGPAACAAGGVVPQGSDGRITVEGDSWGFGANVGWMLPLADGSYVGVSYRTPIRHKLSGEGRFSLPAFSPPYSALTAAIVDSGAKVDITMPGMFSVSARAQLTPRLAILGDVTHTEWSRFDELRIRFESGAQDAVIPAHWKNTIRTSIGIAYDASPALRLRGGVTYEPSTVPDRYRTARVPDNDQTLVAMGFGFRLSPTARIDMAYGRVFVKDAPIDNTIAGSGTLRGEYRLHANILSVQYRVAF